MGRTGVAEAQIGMGELPQKYRVLRIGYVQSKVGGKTLAPCGIVGRVAHVGGRVITRGICAPATTSEAHTSYEDNPVGEAVIVSVELYQIGSQIDRVIVGVIRVGEVSKIWKGALGNEGPLLPAQGELGAAARELVAQLHYLIPGEAVRSQSTHPERVEHAIVCSNKYHTVIAVVQDRGR